MHLANDLAASIPVYQPAWQQARTGGEQLSANAPVVHIGAEPVLRDEIQAELQRAGVEVIEHLPIVDNIGRCDSHQPTCVILDVDMQDADISSLLNALVGKDNPPVILIGPCHDPRIVVRAMKLGAFDYLPKPVHLREIVSAISAAVDYDRRQAVKRLEERILRTRLASLTRREREVLPLVVGGLLNKQAASLLGISEITLQIHRGQVMRKMQANSLADLVRMCVKLRVRHWRPTT